MNHNKDLTQSPRENKNQSRIIQAPEGMTRSNSCPNREPYLPPTPANERKYTLVLDLDETLVHFDQVPFHFNSLEKSPVQSTTLRYQISQRNGQTL